MRSFIVTSKHDVESGPDIFSEVKMELIYAKDLVELFKLINISHGEDCILYNEGTELEMLSEIYESNGDGDWYFIIGELKIVEDVPDLPDLTIILD